MEIIFRPSPFTRRALVCNIFSQPREGLMKRTSSIIAGLIFLLTAAAFSQQVGTNTAAFLKLAPNARAAGMGHAFTGLADDVFAMYWNPGGLGFLNRYELGISGQNLFGELLHLSVFGSNTRRMFGTERATFGLGLIYLGATQDIQSTENNREAAVSAGDVNSFVLLVPFGYRLDPISKNISVGINYKLVRNKLADFSASGHGADLGVLARFSMSNDAELSLGAALQNLTLVPVKFAAINEDLPQTLRAGAAYKMPLGEKHWLTLAFDASKPADNNLKHNFGAEYWWRFSSFHKLGLRAGYRALSDDLGDLSLSLGYGLNLAQVDYAFNNYNPNFLGNANLGSLYFHSSTLEPFRRLLPEPDAVLKAQERIELAWEQARDYSSPEVRYLAVLDTDRNKILQLADKGRARKIFQDAESEATLRSPATLSRKLGVLHAEITRNALRSTFVDTSFVTQQFHWAVIAVNGTYQIQIARVGKVGSFTNRKDPDLIPITLNFEPYDRLDESERQGVLRGTVRATGFHAGTAAVKIFDDTENSRLVGEAKIELNPKIRAQSDTFAVDWNTKVAGRHKLRVVVDPDNQQPESDESNNTLVHFENSIPKGLVATKDTTLTEFRTYESIELPTLLYVFFEPNSAEFSRNSVTRNDPAHPDSLLALLGQRLKTIYPRLKITVQGYWHPKSESAVKSSQSLSRLREKAVIDKLVLYGADASQISRGRNYDETLPIAVSRSTVVDPLELAMVYEENRRVEIRVSPEYDYAQRLVNEKKLFQPKQISLSADDRISHLVSFTPHLRSGRPLASIRVEIRATPDDPFPIFAREFPGEAISSPILFQWNCRRTIDGTETLVAFNRSYSFHVIARDTSGYMYTSDPDAFYLEKTTNVIERRIFALAAFDKATPLHQFYLKYLEDIEAAMRENPQVGVRLIGHTDKIGFTDYNAWLSARRAAELARSLDSIMVGDIQVPTQQLTNLRGRIETPLRFAKADTSIWKAYGAGESLPLRFGGYEFGDNARPQGRLLNRRVEIELKDLAAAQRAASLSITQQFIFPADSNRFSNHFTALAFGNTCTWLGTDRGVIKWDIRHGNFSGLLPKEMPPIYVTALLPDTARRVLWVGTKSGLYSVKNDTSWTLYEAGRAGLTGSHINDLQCQQDGGMLVATNEGVLVFDGNKFLQIGSIHTGLSDNDVNRLYRDNAGQLWACTRQGVSVKNGERWQLFQPEASGQDGLAFDEVRNMAIAGDGSYWFATPRGVRHLANNQWRNFDRGDDLPSANVTDLSFNPEGKLWCATDNGIAVFDQDQWTAFAGAEGLPNNAVNRIVRDHHGRLYVCTRGGMIVLSNAPIEAGETK
jgi:outer membrane protein OmpA-like peptidoglycan-associated protein/sugar lactone lactonase YvrE